MSQADFLIERIDAAADRAAALAALDLTLRELPDGVRAPFIAGLLPTTGTVAVDFGPLWRARDRTGSLRGAVWAQGKPGETATVWPPQWIEPHDPRAADPTQADPLLAALLGDLAAGGTTLAQSLLPDRMAAEATTLERSGFHHLAELCYLTLDVEAGATPTPLPAADADRRDRSTTLHAARSAAATFDAVTADSLDRLAALVDATYVGSLDCPLLDGLRRGREVIDEYRAIGTSAERWWRFVRVDDRDIGCLILADHPHQNQLELVYMGIVPSARGQNRGEATVREAVRLAAMLGRTQIVLAVDAANVPAATMYKRCGFVQFDVRSAYVCRLVAPTTRG